tara:strand:+ start:864 stop:1055 length:192 start_codon:yes stop_codon:yes gene_type:complete
MGFNKEEQTQLCFVVPNRVAETIDDLSEQMGVTRSQFLRKGTIEFTNYHTAMFERLQKSKSLV